MPYTVNGIEYDFDSSVNHRIKQDFVNREVMCCMTSEVEYILRSANELSSYDAPFTEEDVSNYFVKECDKCGSQYGFDEFYPDDEEIEIDKDEDGAYMCPVCGLDYDTEAEARECALPGFVDSKNDEKTERNAGYLVVSHSGGGMLRQGTRKGIRRTPANRGMRAHWVVKGLDISEDVCHGLCP